MNVSATAFIKAAIRTDLDFALWALFIVYKGQTDDEQDGRVTRWSNRRGFSAADANMLSRVAEANAVREHSPQNDLEVPASATWAIALGKYASQIVDVVMWGDQ